MLDHSSRWFRWVRALFARASAPVCDQAGRPKGATEAVAGEIFLCVTAHGIDFRPRERREAEVTR